MKLTILDLALIGTGAFFGGVEAGLSTDAANQYVEGHWLFWLRICCAAITASCTTMLGYLKALAATPPNKGT